MCQACITEILGTRGTGKQAKLTHMATHRTCELCRRFVPNDRFTRRSNGTCFSACKACNRHVFAQRRRARLAGAEGSYTREEWEALPARFDRCPGCGRRWEEIPPLARGGSVVTVDHIVPISKGGSNRIEKARPLSFSCNSRKGAKPG
jgi:5-methylcytosine-specific restriction endonuclease McrA